MVVLLACTSCPLNLTITVHKLFSGEFINTSKLLLENFVKWSKKFIVMSQVRILKKLIHKHTWRVTRVRKDTDRRMYHNKISLRVGKLLSINSPEQTWGQKNKTRPFAMSQSSSSHPIIDSTTLFPVVLMEKLLMLPILQILFAHNPDWKWTLKDGYRNQSDWLWEEGNSELVVLRRNQWAIKIGASLLLEYQFWLLTWCIVKYTSVNLNLLLASPITTNHISTNVCLLTNNYWCRRINFMEIQNTDRWLSV